VAQIHKASSRSKIVIEDSS